MVGSGQGAGRGDPCERRADLGEARAVALPVGAGIVDLFARAAHEVPPHEDLLPERLPAEEEQPGVVGGAQAELVATGIEVGELARLHRRPLNLHRTVGDDEGVLPADVERHRGRPWSQRQVGAHQRRVVAGR